MWWLLLVLGLMGVVVVLIRRSGRTTSSEPEHHQTETNPPPRALDLETETTRMLREVEADAARMRPQVEAEAAKLEAEAARAAWRLSGREPASPRPKPDPSPPAAQGASGGPSWMSAEDWEGQLLAYRRQGRSPAEIARVAAHLEERGAHTPRSKPTGRPVTRDPGGSVVGGGSEGMVIRSDFVPKEDEARYLTRDESGLPTLRLVDAGDRLSIWSPVAGGALINPKGPGLRRLGLYASYARGAEHYQRAYRAADLRKGKWVDLVRQPENPHDANAVAMCAPGSRDPFAYVQRGRARAIASRMDSGEDIACVSMRGPARGRDDDVAFVLIGSRVDLGAMLTS